MGVEQQEQHARPGASASSRPMQRVEAVVPVVGRHLLAVGAQPGDVCACPSSPIALAVQEAVLAQQRIAPAQTRSGRAVNS